MPFYDTSGSGRAARQSGQRSMPASVAHAVFCGDIFFVFQSFRKGGHIHETADQVTVFGHHSGITELIQLLRGTAVVSGQAVRRKKTVPENVLPR